MSIQETNKKQFKRKLINLFGIERLLTLPSLGLEMIDRAVKSDPLKIYFRYKHINADLHPFFERYYQPPSIKYCNRRDAKMYHWISYPDILDNKPFILEPNDHPLSVIGVLNPIPIEPIDVIKNMNKGIELVYDNPKCKKVLVESTGQWELFERYCPQVLNKCEVVRLGTIPKRKIIINTPKESINFLCLASDFKKKAVDILLDAWFEFPHRAKHNLIIACPFIPVDYQKRGLKENVKFILKAPLSIKEKDALYREANVTIGPLHIDGGANLLESMEYGLPFITMRSQRSKDQIMNNNGFVADVPFYFYDDGYGAEWPTWNSFFNLIEKAKLRGDFDITKIDFINAFNFFNDNPHKIEEMGINSYEMGLNEFSLEKRNKQLRQIYQDINDGLL
jgi:hypothetical protein